MIKINYSQFTYEIADKIMKKMLTVVKTKSYSDKTFTAKITEVISARKCRALYSGNTYTVSTTIPCAVDDIVRVCAPCNNWKDLFVVENKTKAK